MFADPRSGVDRRKKAAKGAGREDDQRGARDRRIMHRGEVREWWLARRYVTAEIITGDR
jgi:hypothetical protein